MSRLLSQARPLLSAQVELLLLSPQQECKQLLATLHLRSLLGNLPQCRPLEPLTLSAKSLWFAVCTAPPPPLPFISEVLPALKPLALYFAPCPLHLFYFYDSHYFLKFTFLTTHVVCRPPPTGRRVQQTGTPHQGGGPRDLGGGREGAGQVLPSAKLQASVTGRGLEQFNLYFPIYSA